ncbi:hypothetical protein BJ546DRAFT_595358 [Cryomyces antarcticus]
MSPVTERAFLPLIAGADINDQSSDAGKVWQSTLETVTSQDGCQRAYYGCQLEDPTMLELLIDWDSKDSHQKFIDSDAYGPFGKHLGTIMSGGPELYHVKLTTPHTTAFSAPVLELATFYFESESSDVEAAFEKFAKVAAKSAEGLVGAASGWSIEEVEHSSLKGKGKARVLVAGWQSVDAHMKYRETQEFKESVPLLREKAKGAEMHHVELKAS